MTEDEWLTSTDPQAMLAFVRESGRLPERKARLLACACCRRVWDVLPDERSRRAVGVAGRFAGGAAGQAEIDQAHDDARLACWAIKVSPDRTASDDAAEA